jgi:beta-glucosidase
LPNDWIGNAKAVVQTFYPGQEAGNALARLLFGDVNFSGKLPFTVAAAEADYPAFQNVGTSATVDYLHGYRKIEADNKTPTYWFGYGMSYTTYEYSNPQVLCSNVSAAGRLNVQVTVRNTGNMPGDEVVQLYVAYPNTAAPKRPPKELKAFTRVSLAAGESKDVQLTVPASDLAYWGAGGWVVEKVQHTVLLGPSADPTKLLSLPFTIN